MNSLLLIFIILVTTQYYYAIGAANQNRNLRGANSQKINKCCPFGECVGRAKRCMKTPISQNFSKPITIYTKDLYETGKSLEDVFNISDNKFENRTFRTESMDISYLDFKVYLTESGVLLLELPNDYDRWTPVPTDNFCIDCRVYSRKSSVYTARFFASLPEPEEDYHHYVKLGYATFISCFFLLLVLLVYMLLPELRNLSGVILMAYVISLFTAYLLLGIIQSKVLNDVGCICLTMGIYFSLLASFFWMNVMALDVWWTIRGYAKGHHIQRRGERLKFLMYCLYAFGVPLLMTTGLFLLNMYRRSMRHLPWLVVPHVPDYGCFLDGGTKLLYLYIPMLILILINCLLYLKTGLNVLRLRRKLVSLNTTKSTGVTQAQNTHKQRFRDYLKLSVMMGLNWILEVLSFMYPGYLFWVISDIYNALIGLVLFVIFVCNKKVWDLLCDLFKRKKVVTLPPVAYSTATVYTTESESQPVDIPNKK